MQCRGIDHSIHEQLDSWQAQEEEKKIGEDNHSLFTVGSYVSHHKSSMNAIRGIACLGQRGKGDKIVKMHADTV